MKFYSCKITDLTFLANGNGEETTVSVYREQTSYYMMQSLIENSIAFTVEYRYEQLPIIDGKIIYPISDEKNMTIEVFPKTKI